MPNTSQNLGSIRTFDDLVRYLEDNLDWPMGEYGFDDLTFEYQPQELGLKEEEAAKVKAIRQLRPLNHGQPWGIFFVEFENKRLPVVVLRRILNHLAIKKRASANPSRSAAWDKQDLLFVTAFGDEHSDQREVAFAHFHESPGDLPTLRVLGWDENDTPLKLAHLDETLRSSLRWPDDPANVAAWRSAWRSPFRHKIRHVITTADHLAEVLATLARGIRDRATRLLSAESEHGPLRKLHKAFQTALIHDLTEEGFADTYAQTITYGLLTAAISRTEHSEGRQGTFIVAENITDMVPVTNPFLKEMLQTFLKVGGRKGGMDFDELGVQDVVELLRGDETDLPAILRDFGNKTQGEDPVIHFYEHFLKAYNKKLKIQRGVFYTPQPVVSYIVRSVHELLQTEFGLEDGLAATITWGEMGKLHPEIKIPAGATPETFFVMILDPATGTGTFLAKVIDVIHETMIAKWQKEGKKGQEIAKLWNDYVPTFLLPRLHGYELMMAPYAIAHMKLGLKLYETGYHFISYDRVRVYLTDTLEPTNDDQQKLVGIVPALAHEAEAVNTVKRDVRFTIVIGNPPYSYESSNKGAWISELIRLYYFLDGKSLGEKNPKGLQDDYVKFIRYGQHCIDVAGVGILGFITNHGYLDNPTFRGMRQSLMRSFKQIALVDLHGNSKKKEKDIDGGKDENVFDIQQGVAIGCFINFPEFSQHVYKGDFYGERETKYNLLAKSTLLPCPANEIYPKQPHHLFTNFIEKSDDGYDRYESISTIFPTNSVGIVTGRDHIAVQFLATDVDSVLQDLIKLDEMAFNRKYDTEDSADWSYANARNDIMLNKNMSTVKLYYRPFDIRHTCYTGKSSGFHSRPRSEVMNNMLFENVALLSSRMTKGEEFAHSIATNEVSEKIALSPKTSNNSYHYPLWIYKNLTSQRSMDFSSAWLPDNNGRVPNLFPDFVKTIESAISLKFSPGLGSNTSSHNSFTPIDIYSYIYAILNCPSYRARYAEYLKIDFPRVPVTSNLELFLELAKLGGKLVALHLLESPKIDDFITIFAGKGDNSVPKKPTWKDNAVWINATQRFEGVPESVWNFHIGGYQVCEKWLKDRKGRILTDEDITHYQRVVVALNETIRLMAEIDEVIDQHGGWPIR